MYNFETHFLAPALKEEISRWDILLKNLFDQNHSFEPVSEKHPPHPMDIYEIKEGLVFEIACTGLYKSEVDVQIEGNNLKVSYNKKKDKDNPENNYIVKSIAKRSFNLAYRISSKYDLTKAKAEMKNGLLTIFIPFSIESKPKSLVIS
jgi:HSP20 family molecular chaperone IbpA